MRQKPILLSALLVLATLLLYGPVTHHEFVWDDSAYVTKNIHVSTGLNLGNVVGAFTSFHQGNWHPLTWISHMADCQLFGLSSGPHHLVNVVLHAVNVLLLFWLLQRATGAVWRSFLVAALFAAHPLNVETVAWVAQRKSLLSAFFLTHDCCLWLVRSAARLEEIPGRRRRLFAGADVQAHGNEPPACLAASRLARFRWPA